MKVLYLLRHAKSSWAEPGLPDRERPLNPRGRKNAPGMARRLCVKGVRLDQAIASPAQRAWETLCFFTKSLEVPKTKVRVEEALYDATVEVWLRLIRQLDESWQTVMMVGHNPAITDLAHFLGRTDILNVPTCGILECCFHGEYWGSLEEETNRLTINFDYPKRAAG